MRRIDNARLDALQRAVEVLDSHKTTFQSYKPLKTRHILLAEQVEALEALRNSLSVDSEGKTAAKAQAFVKLQKMTISIAKIAEVWAHENQHHTILPILDLELTDFKTSSFFDALELAKNLEQTLRPYLEELEEYDITTALLDDLKAHIETFRDAMPKPKLDIATRKSSNTAYRTQSEAAMILLRHIENLLIGKYQDSHPEMVNALIAAARVHDPYTRKTAVVVEVADQNGQPLQGVSCDLLEVSGEEQNTDEEGKAELIGIKAGTYTLKVHKPGFAPLQSTVTVNRGQRITLKLQLAS